MQGEAFMPNEKRLVRSALGAGKWFPADHFELEAALRSCFEDSVVPTLQGRIVAIISPHAGYQYSGPVAATAYKAVQENILSYPAPDVTIVLGFGHRGSFRGVALMDGSTFATPIGQTPLDVETASFLVGADPRITMDYRPHIGEHSAENQVPFLQTILPKTPLVIALIGSHDPALIDAFASALQKLARKKSLLVVASSDMLHDPNYELVRKTDQSTLKKVTAMDTTGILKSWNFTRQVFCGIAPVITAMKYAQQQGCSKATVLRYRNSGDQFPESRGQWVVGYGAIAFTV
jgi:AmmeMemoRadiSam system protein B